MSFLAPTGVSESQCGYCHSKSPTSKSHGAWAYSLSPSAYQALIDHGWRRSGQYLYKPSPTTCCNAYTIRLDTTKFTLSKGQKKTLKKMKRFVVDGIGKVTGEQPEDDMDVGDGGSPSIDERVTGTKDIPKSMQHLDKKKQSLEESSNDATRMQRDSDLDASGPITNLLLTSEGFTGPPSQNPFRVPLSIGF